MVVTAQYTFAAGLLPGALRRLEQSVDALTRLKLLPKRAADGSAPATPDANKDRPPASQTSALPNRAALLAYLRRSRGARRRSCCSVHRQKLESYWCSC